MSNSQLPPLAKAFEAKPIFCHPLFDIALEQLRFTYTMQPIAARTALIIGNSGVGKSEVAETFVAELNRSQDYAIAYRVRLKSPDSIPALLKQIAEPIVNLPSKLGQDDMRRALHTAIKKQGVKFIAIDEAQSAIPPDKNKAITLSVAEELKHLNDIKDVTIALFGTDDTENLLLEAKYKKLSHGQLETRTNAAIKMKNFEYDEDWTEVVKYILRNVTAHHSLEYNEDIKKRVFIATNGNFRHLEDLFSGAHVLVDTGQHKEINYQTLAHSYDMIISNVASNPFLLEADEIEDFLDYPESYDNVLEKSE